MIRFLFAFVVLFFAGNAHASYWVVCDVTAFLELAPEENVYGATIFDATVLDGHHKKGEPCLDKIHGDTNLIEISGNPPPNQNVKLKYNYYDSMGPNGIIVEEKWEYMP